MSTLQLSLVQSRLYWEDAPKNLAHFEKLFARIEASDLILLPEMFSTAFTMEAANNAEKMMGPSMQWMQKWAKQKQAVIAGSLIIEEEGRFYNRFIWMNPDGTHYFYDKRHLFSMAGENEHFSAGRQTLMVDYKGWKICPLVCYDLRFPVWSRQQQQQPYDLLLYVANWPEARISAWEKLLYARAIENQAFVAGVNRVGHDEKGLSYNGVSMLIDMKGEAVWKGEAQQESVFTTSISLDPLQAFRKKFPVGDDADTFRIG